MAAQHRSQGTPSPRKRKRSVITSASALPPNGGAGGVLAPNAKWARGKRRAGPVSAERSGAEQSGPAVMAAVPQNNLREQLRLHSARGALSKVLPARSRPA